MNGVLSHDFRTAWANQIIIGMVFEATNSALEGYIGDGITWADEMNFGMNHAAYA